MPDDVFPASAAQQRLWFAARLDPGSCAYTLGQVYLLDGPLDPKALDTALGLLVRRHRSLRTRFAERDGVPVQVVDPSWQAGLTGADVTEEQVLDHVERIFAEPFDLGAGPLFRAHLLRTDDESHALALTMHHIISDGWSLNIMLRDLAVLYTAVLDGVAPVLPAQVAEYTDLIAGETEYLRGAECADMVARWVDRLDGAPTLLPLPTRTSRRAGFSFAGRCLDFDIPDALTGVLRRTATENYATLHMAAFAVFQALLSRVSGQDDLVVGMPIVGRTEPAAQDVVGFFVNALPIRADLRDGPSFTELVERVQESTLDAFTEQNVPFERIVEALNPVRHLGVNPLVQATFQLFEGAIGTDLRLRGTTGRPLSGYRRSVAFDLTFDLYHVDGRLRGQLHYREELFSRAAVEAFVAAFVELLGAALAAPDCPIPVLPLAGADGLGAEVVAAGKPDAERSLYDKLTALAQADPDRVVLVCGQQRITSAQLLARSEAGAAALAARGLNGDSLVEVTGSTAVVGVLGAWRAGVPVLVGTGDTPFTADFAFDADTLEDLPTGPSPEPPGLDAPAALIRTTSGRPTPVLVTHRALAGLAGAATGEHRQVALTPGVWRDAPWNVLLHVLSGAEVHLLSTSDTATEAGLVAVHEDEVSRVIAAEMLVHTSSVHPLDSPDAVHLWGPAECLGHALRWPDADPFAAVPVAGAGIAVLDAAGRPVRAGIVGEICVSAGHLASGYPGRAAETAEFFPPDPRCETERLFRTGERGRISADGQVQVLGVQEESLLDQPADDVPFEPPRTGTEEVVAEVTATLLGLPRVGRLDNFFAAGGHSLTAVQLVSRLRAALGTDLSVRSVFERPTVAALAELIDASGTSTQSTLAVRRQPGPAPASFGQRRLWFLQRMEPDGSAYNMYAPFRIFGPLDLAALRTALDRLTTRHDSLRTRLREIGGQLVQLVDDAWTGELSGSALPAGDAPVDDRIQAHLDAITSVPFDLAEGPVFGADLLEVGPDDHLLTLTMHHAMSDGHSVAVLVRDLSGFYNAAVTGEAAQLPALPVQYGDYAAWQHETLQGAVLDEHLAYWTTHVEGAPQLLPLPADREPVGTPGTAGGIVGFEIPRALVDRLRALGQEQDATLFMVTLAVFEVLLAKVSGEPDLLVGVPVDGRGRTELENLVGFFINTLPVRADLTGDPVFRDLLARTRDSALSAYEYQELPFERIVEEVNPERRPGTNPLVQVTFHLFAEAQPDGVGFTGTQSLFRDTFNRTARFDLSLDLHQTHDALLGFLCFREDQYSRERAEAIVAYYQELLDLAVSTPDLTLSAFGVPAELEPHAVAAVGLRPDSTTDLVAFGGLEIMVATVMAEVLGEDQPLERDDDFFVNGGHSLTAVQLASRLQSILGTEVSVLTVFENPTVDTLAVAIAEAQESTVPPLRPGMARRPAPVSFAQQRLWLIQEVDLDSTAYNMYDPTRIRGPLDHAALAGAITALAARHEALRTRFDVVDGELVQIVDDTWTGELDLTDLRREPEALPGILRAIASRPYDLATDVLFRAELIALADDDHVLALSMHHILSDGRSMSVLKSDLSALYNAARAGRPAELPELSVQYSDYAAWQRELLSGETLERELSYWTGHLDGAPELLDLPTDFPRTTTVDADGGVVYFELDADLTARLRRIAATNSGTLFMVVLAAFQAQMARSSGQSDVVVGVPVACRTQAEVENVVGFFINTLPIRADVGDDPGFEDLLARTRDHFLAGLAHQELPFDRVVEALNPERLLGTVPLVQVACQLFEEEIINGLRLDGADSEYHGVFNQTARFDLQLDLFRVGKGFNGALYYRRDLFRHETAEDITSNFLAVLAAIGEDPGRRVGDLPIVTDADLRKVVA
jgi:non-ribosomal peptide synthetase component F